MTAVSCADLIVPHSLRITFSWNGSINKSHQGLCLQLNWVSVDGGGDPPWANLAETWKAQGSVFAGIHVEHLVKSSFFHFEGENIAARSEECVLNIMHTEFTAAAWKLSLKFSSIFGHQELPAQRNERLCFISTFPCMNERIYWGRTFLFHCRDF